jgi:hypothetical protein
MLALGGGMPNRFTTIGFPILTKHDLREYAQLTVDNGEPFEAESGRYVRWSMHSRAELWARTDRQSTASGLYPHFAGDAVVRGGLTERIARPNIGPLDGAFYFWTNAHHSDPEDGDYPLVFDAPDYELYRAVEWPRVVDVQLAAFAHDLEAFPNDEAFRTRETLLASEAFVPMGLFGHERGQEGELVLAEQPQAYAWFTGHVLQTSLLTNSVTGADFHQAMVQTSGGCQVDVVADPVVLDGTLVEGGVIEGLFWLSGRLLV